jgi:hypothetical protein
MVIGAATAQKIQNWDETTTRSDPSEEAEKESTLKMVFSKSA